MAKRRCFSSGVYESKAYLNLSKDAKILYTELIFHSDDEGVVINPEIPMCILGVDERALAELVEQELLILVDDVYVIRHWYLHNKVQPSRMIQSLYQTQLSKLTVNQRKEYEFL